MRLPNVRIRVRTLMILVLLVGCGLGWVMHRARVQREAVEAIRKAGGSVLYDWQWTDDKPIPNAQPPGPRWLRAHVGPEFFDEVTSVWFSGSQTTDAMLIPVGRLRRVEHVGLMGPTVSDAGLKPLAGLTRLEQLFIRCPMVGDAGLMHLAKLTRLKKLYLFGTRVTDDGIYALRKDLPDVVVVGPEGRVYPSASDHSTGTPAK